MRKKNSVTVRVFPETKKLLDEAKKYPEETYDRLIKRVVSDSNAGEPATNPDGLTPLEEKAYKSQMKDQGVKE